MNWPAQHLPIRQSRTLRPTRALATAAFPGTNRWTLWHLFRTLLVDEFARIQRTTRVAMRIPLQGPGMTTKQPNPETPPDPIRRGRAAGTSVGPTAKVAPAAANDPAAKPGPWLITAWPGMGNVAMIAAVYLVERLKAEPFAELSSVGHFDVDKVEVKDGLVQSTRMPHSIFYRWVNPKGRDLIIFVGEAQPSTGTYAFAHALLEHASKLGIERVITIASMASQLHPTAEPRVFGVATDQAALDELRRLETKPLDDGQVGGLNGVMLGVAAERGVPGVCLLGEIPYFAAGVPNPKAAKAVLEVLAVLAGVEVGFAELSKHSAVMDKAILELLKRLQEQGAESGSGEFPAPDDEGEESAAPTEAGGPQTPGPEPREQKPLDFAARSRIEELFAEARRDRKRAVRLKETLDELGVFQTYENRFLDLFKRAG